MYKTMFAFTFLCVLLHFLSFQVHMVCRFLLFLVVVVVHHLVLSKNVSFLYSLFDRRLF